MRAMTEIEWLDGRVTKVPELALGDALGESVQAELDFGFDDVLEGLWVGVRHHEPDEDSDGDPRGRGYALYADCRYSLVEPSDLDRVFCILYEGQPRVQPRRGGAREPFAGLRVVLPHAEPSTRSPRLDFGAVTNLCDATSALTAEGDLPSSLAISLHDALRSSILWTVSRSCLVSLP